MPHTQGDWDYTIGDVANRSSSSIFKKGDPEWMIATVVCESRNPLQREEDIANLKLLWAAPKLLASMVGLFEHCAMVHKHCGDGDNTKEADAAIAAARAAIAAATGEDTP